MITCRREEFHDFCATVSMGRARGGEMQRIPTESVSARPHPLWLLEKLNLCHVDDSTKSLDPPLGVPLFRSV